MLNRVQTADPEPRAAPPEASKFDAYAQNYTELHRQNLKSSGEDPEYFARYKVECLRRLGATGPVLDYGCGIGNLTLHLAQEFEQVCGTDPSRESLRVARARVPTAEFTEEPPSEPRFNTAVLAGVLHHVPPPERETTVRRVREALRPGGRLVVFEHNPLNPVTRRAVRECPFDDDAILLFPWELRRLLARAGFDRVEQRYIVFFPRVLAPLRRLEPKLGWLAFGAQTLTVATR